MSLNLTFNLSLVLNLLAVFVFAPGLEFAFAFVCIFVFNILMEDGVGCVVHSRFDYDSPSEIDVNLYCRENNCFDCHPNLRVSSLPRTKLELSK